MSVMQLNPESFKKNVYGINKFSSSYLFGTHVCFDELEPTFAMLQYMNAKSYSERYHEELRYIPFDEVNSDRHQSIPGLLKSLQCLAYNIELDKMDSDEKNAFDFLKGHIMFIQNYLINQIPEYENAEWS